LVVLLLLHDHVNEALCYLMRHRRYIDRRA
jgi:hypothetical protein